MKNLMKKTKKSQQKWNNSDFKKNKKLKNLKFQKKKIVIWNISDREKIVKKKKLKKKIQKIMNRNSKMKKTYENIQNLEMI